MTLSSQDFPAKMRFKKYIVVVPTVGSKLDLLPFDEKRYTWVSLWHDLGALHGKCIFQQFKIFVDQPDPDSSPPKLFVCTLVNAQCEEEAYCKGREDVLALSSSLVRLFKEGYEPEYHEMTVIPLHQFKLPPTMEDGLSVLSIELRTRNGKVEEVATPYGTFKPTRHFGKAIHEEFMNRYFAIPIVAEGTFAKVTISMSRKELLFDIDAGLEKTRAFESSDEGELMNVVATLYSAAVTTANMSVSYLLLWQILESLASGKDSGQKLLTDTTMNGIFRLLQQEGHEVITIQKIHSVLGMLREKSETRVIAEMLRE